MLKAYKYRIYPNKSQKELINKHIGSTRFLYNLALETKLSAYASNRKYLSLYDLIKQIPDLKKECMWLKEINSQSLQMSLRNLDKAFTGFFKGKSNFPKYKSKWNGSQSFNIPQHIKLENNTVKFPKFNEGIKIVIHRNIKGKIKQGTISRSTTGKFYISILCETNECIPKKHNITNNTVGIDLGIKDFLITSNKERIKNPKYLKKLENKLKYNQRKYSKYKGKRTKKKISKLHEKIRHQRMNFLHQISSKLVKENQSIAIENLDIKGMMQNGYISKSISDVSWGAFIRMLKYKSEWYGKNLIQIGRFEPSSKTCSVCGNINKNLELKDRTWSCYKCNTDHDRDVNAAINIKNFALKKYVSGVDTKNHGELPTLVRAMTRENNKL